MKYRFIRADVAVRALGAGDAALVAVVDRSAPRRWRRSPRRSPRCLAERHRLGGTAVILQGTELGVAVDAGTGGIGVAEVPAAVGDGAGAVAPVGLLATIVFFSVTVPSA